jgi:hypothetical protein
MGTVHLRLVSRIGGELVCLEYSACATINLSLIKCHVFSLALCKGFKFKGFETLYTKFLLKGFQPLYKGFQKRISCVK